MRPDVHLRPDRLHAHAGAAVELAGALESALAARPRGGTDRGTAELDAALRRAARELAELAAVLAVAAAAESADRDSAQALHRAGRS
jgi:molybdenum-dependent DNA-binding transcriptional regulator ModE